MSTPRKREWDAGKDAYGRPVTLINVIQPDGKNVWSIVSQPIAQRDEGERIHSLTLNSLRAIAAIVEREPS